MQLIREYIDAKSSMFCLICVGSAPKHIKGICVPTIECFSFKTTICACFCSTLQRIRSGYDGDFNAVTGGVVSTFKGLCYLSTSRNTWLIFLQIIVLTNYAFFGQICRFLGKSAVVVIISAYSCRCTDFAGVFIFISWQQGCPSAWVLRALAIFRLMDWLSRFLYFQLYYTH